MQTIEVFTDMDMKAFADRLLLARRKAGLSQQQLCLYADLAPTHYSGLERGKKDGVRVNTLYRLCQVLRVSADYLLGLPPACGAPEEP